MHNVVKKVLIATLAILALAAGIYFSQTLKPSDNFESQSVLPQQSIQGLLWPDPKQLTDFQLTDHHGEIFDRSRLLGNWSLLFFGYSHCPDVCPGTISMLNTVVKGLEKNQQANSKHPAPQVIFISVDPDRDTPDHLSGYISYFNEKFVAVTGSQDKLAVLTKQLGILAMKVENEDSADINDYLMDHSASVLLISPDAQLVGIFSAPHDPQDIQNRYIQIRDFIEK